MIRGGESKTTFSAQFPSYSPFACLPPSLRSLSTISLRFIPLRPRPPSLKFFSSLYFLAAALFFFFALPSAFFFAGFETCRLFRRLPLTLLFPFRLPCAPGNTADCKPKFAIFVFSPLQALSCFLCGKTQTPFFINSKGGDEGAA